MEAYKAAVNDISSEFGNNVRAIPPYEFSAQTGHLVLKSNDAFTVVDTLVPKAHIQTVKLNENVTEIPTYAFLEAENLSSVSCGDITSIGAFAFVGCPALTQFTIPSTLETLGDYAFLGCDNIAAFNVGDSNKHFSVVNDVLFNEVQTTLLYSIRWAGKRRPIPCPTA